MQDQIRQAGDLILNRFSKLDGPVRILVGIAGAPGSGKSTLAYPLVEYINASTAQTVSSQHMAQEPTAIAVGLDGWHHSRAELDAFPDPVEARRRRGAAFTFNALDYVAFVRALRSIPAVPQVTFPIFSHAVKDPTPSPSPILPNHKIVIIEGLYTLLDIEPWSEATDELDLRIWVECDRKVARERLIARHLESGIEPDRQAAEIRVDGSDMVNGEFVREHLVEPTLRVDSADDPAFAASHKQ